MRRTLRETPGGPLSLFAFQDIIFSVTAVLLFATIWFALSTRVQRFSRAADPDGAQRQLAAAIAALAESEAAKRLSESGAAWADGDRSALEAWSAQQLAVDDAPQVAAGMRERVQAQERRSAHGVMAMQAEESAWADLQRRLPIAEQRARDALLKIERPAAEGREPLVLVLSGDAVQVVPDSVMPTSRPVSLATVEQEMRTIIGAHDPTSTWLWLAVRPSAAPLFDRAMAAAQARGFVVHLEPVAEDQEIAWHRPDRARALLE